MSNLIVVRTDFGLAVDSQDVNGIYNPVSPGIIILSGTHAPSNSLGVNGNYYLDTAAGNLYLKSGGVFSIVTNIRGGGSTPAIPGSIWRTGTGVPSNSLGVDGDLYLDISTNNLYQRVLGTYLLASNIGGSGAPGSIWRTGSGAPSNGLGINGDFYLDTAAGNVYQKAAGVYTIVANISGTHFRTGTTVPSNGLGVNGDLYLRTTTGDVYLRTAGTYSIIENLTGPAGPSGGVSSFAMFFGLTTGTGNGGPNDYAATVAVKTSVGTGRVPFPRAGATGGAGFATAVDASSFTLPGIGKYEVTWKVQTTEVGQLQIELDGVDIAESVTQDYNPTSGGHLLIGSCIVTTTLTNRVLAIVNPAGNATALTITPADGNLTHANAQSITIKKIA